MFKPRPGQDDIINYRSGLMGIAAVPGSGKTHTLSFLAARLVADEDLREDQEILIVTLVNSAVDNFSNRVAAFLKEFNLMPGVGYRVRTLHGLAYDIIREQPSLAGLDNRFAIIDERDSRATLNFVVDNWIRANNDFIQSYSDSSQTSYSAKKDWNELLSTLAENFIKQAKDYELAPQDLRKLLDEQTQPFPLLEMGYAFYAGYQQALQYRGAVDFEDLIRLAYRVLRNNRAYLEKLRERWPIILEDEAQDSSRIQQKLLGLLCGDQGNWVRVGDPNQAIFETFTTAEPRLLREFLQRDDVLACDLKYSGRSAPAIIDLANFLNRWCQQQHPVVELRDTLSTPLIFPAPPGDPQPNPADTPDNIIIHNEDLMPEREIELVARSVKKWLQEHPQSTLAILVPRNARGAELAERLASLKIPFTELLKSSKSTRDTARNLANILDFYIHPSSKKHIQNAILSIISARYGNKLAAQHTAPIRALLNVIKFPESVFDQMEAIAEIDLEDPSSDMLFQQAVNDLRSWQRTVLLPIDQMIMTISMHLFQEIPDLALSYKLAILLDSAAQTNPDWRLADFQAELDQIARNRFRLYGFSSDDIGFDPDAHQGEAVISTIHKAKGLEWDRVYVLSVNNYDFPSVQLQDSYISEKWFVRDQLNLEAEMIAQLKALVFNHPLDLHQPEGEATRQARLDYSAERLRLLYVAITRARRELVITRNSGRNKSCREALPLTALRNYLESDHGKQA